MSEWTARPATRPCVWRVESPFETLRPALRPTHAARSRALSAPSTGAVACGRPRRGAVAALVPRWSHDDDHLPGGRVTRALPPPAKRATRAGRGANAGTAQRAGDGGSTYPANQHRVCIHTLSCVRRLTMLVPIGTAFGYGTRTHTLSRTLRSPSIGRAEARATDVTRGDSRALLDESTARAGRVDRSRGRVDRSRRSSGPLAKVLRLWN